MFNSLLLAVGDLLALALAVWLNFEFRGAFFGSNLIPKLATVVLPAWLASAWLEGLFPAWGVNSVEHLRRITRSTLTAFLLTTTVLYFSAAGSDWTRLGVLASSLLALPLLIGMRWLMRRGLLLLGIWGEDVIVLGAGKTGEMLVKNLKLNPGFGQRPVRVLDDDPQRWGQTLHGVPITGPLEDVRGQSHTVFVAMPGLSRQALLGLLQGPLGKLERVLIVPDFLGLESQWVEAKSVSNVLSLEVQRHLLKPEAQVAKRVLDLLGSSIGGLLILPLVLGIAVLVRLDSSGAVIFRQTRVGRDGRTFSVLKFRTMHQNAEKRLRDTLDADPLLQAEWAKDQKLKHDPRVTRVGMFLRKTSLDELPQLWNVLRGEMSLVGPRPIVPDEVARYGQAFELYARVSPGMAGLWQVSGRSSTTYEERVNLDAYYIRNWSVWLDLMILVRLPSAMISSKGAY